ncbi:LruC domain-containing protein [Parabacteroides distasonis]|uniref:LruC domain-containing protein n=1 Tax=Parabacteroides distasonis TaxID=823 RepID=UPI0039B54A63
MKRCIFTKVKFMTLFLFAVLMVACTTDVYEPKPDSALGPKPEPENPENPIVDIVNSIFKSRNLTVNIVDAYDGKYYYTIEAFAGNPAIDERARLLAGQKVNSKVPFNVNISIPDSENEIFIRQTDPFKRKRVYAFPVQDGDMVCNLGSIANTKSSSGSVLRSASYEMPEVDFSPLGATAISGKQQIKTGGKYIVNKDAKLNISSLPGEGNFSLYIKGEAKLTTDYLTLQNNAKIYILSDGELTAGKNNIVLNCVGNAQIAVEKDGFLGDDDGEKLSLSFTDQSRLINHGDVELNGKKANGNYSLALTSSASIYNDGEMDITGGLSTTDRTNLIVNYGEFDIEKTLMLTNGEIYNACVFETDICDVNGGTIILASYSGFECDKFTAGGLHMYMDAFSIFDCTDDDKDAGVHFTTQTNYISGTSDSPEYALFRANKVILGGWNSVEYSGMLEIECDHHDKNVNYYKLNVPATFAQGQASVEIDEDDCNKNSGNQNPGEGDGDQDPSYEEVETLPYTYLFEDNWPATGDYDMNDLVIGIQINNKKIGDKTESAKIIYTLYATGATKQIGVGFQLDGISASAVSDAEQGQTNAVIQLFSDAHSLLGSSERTPINTYKVTMPPVENEVTINFNTPIDGVINVNNFNLFIVTNGFDSDRRNEVHIAGYKGTDKAASSDNSTADYVSNETGLMWALSIPSQDFATYPKETIRIDDAYEGFGSWIKGDNTPGWYLNYVDENVIKYDLLINKTE